MASHNVAICRCLYLAARKNGSPVVNILEMGSGFAFGETADGDVSIEGITGCCKWSMKYEVAARWLEKREAINKDRSHQSQPDRAEPEVNARHVDQLASDFKALSGAPQGRVIR